MQVAQFKNVKFYFTDEKGFISLVPSVEYFLWLQIIGQQMMECELTQVLKYGY